MENHSPRKVMEICRIIGLPLFIWLLKNSNFRQYINMVLQKPKLSPVSLHTDHDLFGQLPEDVIFHILSKLSVADLIRFGRASKLSKSLISSQDFLDFRIFKPHPKHHLIFRKDEEDRNRFYFCYPADHSISGYKTVEIPFQDLCFSTGTLKLIGSTGGVICFQHQRSGEHTAHLFLWNPLIRVLKQLPPLPRSWRPRTFFPLLGYDQFNDDFKVLMFDGPGELLEFNLPQGFVYTTKEKKWRTIWRAVPCVPVARDVFDREVVSIDGVVYRQSYMSPCSKHARVDCIMGFDFVKERFEVINFPQQISSQEHLTVRLSTWLDGKSLAVCTSGFGLSWSLFVANVSDSNRLAEVRWEQKLDFQVPGFYVPGYSVPWKFVNAEELIVTERGGDYIRKLIAIDVNKQEAKDLGELGFPSFRYITQYSPSSVLGSYCSLERLVELRQNLFGE